MTHRWEVVAGALRDRIAHGSLPADRSLPTEQELGLEFGVSRITVRRALEQLRTDGLLVAGRGRGWRAAGAREGPPVGVFRVTDDADASPAPLDFETLAFQTRPAVDGDPGDGTRVLRAMRLVTAEGVAVDLVEILIGGPYATSVTEAELDATPPARLLAQKGCPLGRTDQWAAAQTATDADDPLGIEPGAPLLIVHRTVYSGNRPILRTVHRHPGHLVRIDVTFPTTNTSAGSPVRFTRPG